MRPSSLNNNTMYGGIVVTRKSIESKEVIKKLSKEFGGNLSDAESMRLTGLARNTYYKYKRELKGEHGT